MKTKTSHHMSTYFFAIMFTLASLHSFGQTTHDKGVLLGICTRDSLMREPFNSWFKTNYNEYAPDAGTISRIKAVAAKGYSIEIYFGTWCGDSKREVPRFFKVLDESGLNIPVKMIAVSDKDEVYKQSPGKEEAGKGIYRVASFIVYKNGKEVNRITEHPVRSLELDLLDILSGNVYRPNYAAYLLIDDWMQKGYLGNATISERGLARQLKPVVMNSSELNACGYVLIAQGKTNEAVSVFRMNCQLFPENANMYASLAEGLHKAGKKEEAINTLVYAIQINKEAYLVKDFIDLYATMKNSAK